MSTQTSTAPEPYWVEGNRARKAAQIVGVLLDIGATPADVAAFTDDDKRMTEAAAGTKRGSDKTWRVVIEMLAGSARQRSLCPFCGHGDPLGVPGPAKPVGHDGPCAQ